MLILSRTVLAIGVCVLLGASTLADTLTLATPEEVGMSSQRLSAIDDALRLRVQEGRAVGVSVLISRRGKVVYFRQFGLRNLASAKPMLENTIVRIYSMTKAVTSAAALMLCEEGTLSLDDAVAKHLPELADRQVYSPAGNRPARNPITLRHLLLHTSGFVYGRPDGSEVERLYEEADLLNKDDTLEGFVSKLALLPLAFEPGSERSYGLSTDVLGAVVERASGKTLAAFLQERIFAPLGMIDTGFEVPPSKVDRFAPLYTRRGGVWRLVDTPESSRYARPATMFSGGGGLVSTAPDYWRFLTMIAQNGTAERKRLLSQESVDLLTQNQLEDGIAEPTQGYGFGFRVLIDPLPPADKRLLGEYGWFGRASTHCWTNPREQLIVVLLEQRVPSDELYFDATQALVHPLVYDAILSSEE